MIDKGPTCSTPSTSASATLGQRSKGSSRHRQRHQHAGQVPRHGGLVGAVEHGADDRPGAQERQGRQLQGRGLRRLLDDEVQGQRASRRWAPSKKVPADIVAKGPGKQKAILDGSFKVVVDDSQGRRQRSGRASGLHRRDATTSAHVADAASVQNKPSVRACARCERAARAAPRRRRRPNMEPAYKEPVQIVPAEVAVPENLPEKSTHRSIVSPACTGRRPSFRSFGWRRLIVGCPRSGQTCPAFFRRGRRLRLLR